MKGGGGALDGAAVSQLAQRDAALQAAWTCLSGGDRRAFSVLETRSASRAAAAAFQYFMTCEAWKPGLPGNTQEHRVTLECFYKSDIH